MGVNEWRDRRGKLRIYVTKQWPDGSRFKRTAPNKTTANNLLKRIDESIVMGTWRKLKAELARGSRLEKNPTLREFSAEYLKYCHAKNRRPDFKEQAMVSILRIVGYLRIKDFTRAHGYQFLQKRSKEVSSATTNRGIAVIKNMLSYALDQ